MRGRESGEREDSGLWEEEGGWVVGVVGCGGRCLGFGGKGLVWGVCEGCEGGRCLGGHGRVVWGV